VASKKKKRAARPVRPVRAWGVYSGDDLQRIEWSKSSAMAWRGVGCNVRRVEIREVKS